MLKMGKIKNYKGFQYYRITGSVNGCYWKLLSTCLDRVSVEARSSSTNFKDTEYKTEKEIKADIDYFTRYDEV